MSIEITQEMLEAARLKRAQDMMLAESVDNEDPGAMGICIGCE
jgi:hypothetical protein